MSDASLPTFQGRESVIDTRIDTRIVTQVALDRSEIGLSEELESAGARQTVRSGRVFIGQDSAYEFLPALDRLIFSWVLTLVVRRSCIVVQRPNRPGKFRSAQPS